MSNQIFIFGARGHAKVVLDVIEQENRYRVAFLLDDAMKGKERVWFGYPVAGGREVLTTSRPPDVSSGVVAIGQNQARLSVADWLTEHGYGLICAVHPAAVIGRGVEMGQGTVVMAGCVINSDSRIGANVIINTGATVDHDCELADGAHVAPGSHLCGGVRVGRSSLIGAGSTVIPGISIGSRVVVGAGSTVFRDIADGERVAGTPARRLQ